MSQLDQAGKGVSGKGPRPRQADWGDHEQRDSLGVGKLLLPQELHLVTGCAAAKARSRPSTASLTEICMVTTQNWAAEPRRAFVVLKEEQNGRFAEVDVAGRPL